MLCNTNQPVQKIERKCARVVTVELLSYKGFRNCARLIRDLFNDERGVQPTPLSSINCLF